jgi:hypothetical protein
MAEVDTNTIETPEVTPPPALDTPEQETPGSGRSQIRRDLEEGFERTRRDDTQPRRRRGAPEPAPEPEVEEEPTEEEAEAESAPAAAPATAPKEAPAAFSAEAKAEWAKTPAKVQDAILKREQDVNRGVQELRQRYAEVDQALQPRMDLIRRHGHTPGQAVNQLFAWFEALSANPQQAFPALMQSFRLDPRQIFGHLQQQQQPGQQTDQPQDPGIAPQTQQYITNLEQRFNQLSNAVAQKFGSLESTFQAQSEAKTKEILDQWAQGKEHFEEVRQMMAHLIGSGAIPPLPNGGADLDKAYDMAIYALPDIRTRVLTAQETKAKADRMAKAKAEKEAQQAAATKARRAAGGLGLSAPGSSAPPPADSKRGKTVKETLRDALDSFNKGV